MIYVNTTMMDAAPIACSLGNSELELRLGAIAEIGADSLISRAVDGEDHSLRFRNDADTRRRLQEIVSAEAECCAFLNLSLGEESGDLVLAISAPKDAQGLAAGLANAFAGAARPL
jgi:hypothetical protein